MTRLFSRFAVPLAALSLFAAAPVVAQSDETPATEVEGGIADDAQTEQLDIGDANVIEGDVGMTGELVDELIILGPEAFETARPLIVADLDLLMGGTVYHFETGTPLGQVMGLSDEGLLALIPPGEDDEVLVLPLTEVRLLTLEGSDILVSATTSDGATQP